METLKNALALGGDGGTSKDDEQHAPQEQDHEPLSGVKGAGTVDRPYGAGNLPNTAPSTTQTLTAVTAAQHIAPDGAQYLPASHNPTTNISTTASTDSEPIPSEARPNGTSSQDPPEKINSLFNNPFTKRASVSGASKEAPLDPKAKAEDDLPELELVESAVTIYEPKPVKNPFAPSPRQPDMAPQNSKNKGKGKAEARSIMQSLEAQRPSNQPLQQADSGSSISRRSESVTTHSTLTTATTVGSSNGAAAKENRRASYVPPSQHNPGRIPTAGGRPIGQQRYISEESASPGEAGPSLTMYTDDDVTPAPSSPGGPHFNEEEFARTKRSSTMPPVKTSNSDAANRGDSASQAQAQAPRKGSIFERMKAKVTAPPEEKKETQGPKSSGGGGLFRSLSRKTKK